MTDSNVELADRLSQRRARVLPAMAVIFVAQQGAYLAARQGPQVVEGAKISAWLVLSIVLLLVLTTGGFWFRPAAVRQLMNDESTQANRADAYRVGFLASMIGSILLYVFTMFEPLSARDSIHLIMSMGLAAALIRFGTLERRAHHG